MLKLTFLGHQSWIVTHNKTNLYIDPVLFSEYGLAPTNLRIPLEYQVKTKLSSLPTPSAILLTHEHSDHFDPRSLIHFKKNTPIYISEKASTVCFEIIKGLGFKNIKKLLCEKELKIGTLLIHPLSEILLAEFSDEFDTLPLLIRDYKKTDAFLTAVDIWLSPRSKRKIIQLLGKNKRPLINMVGSALRLILAKDLENNWTDKIKIYKTTQKEDVIKILNQKKPLRLLPGNSFEFEKGRCKQVQITSDFIECLGPSPSKSFPRHFKNDKMSIREWKKLENHLKDYAQFLYSRELYRKLFSQRGYIDSKLHPTFAFLLKASNGSRLYEYHAQSSCFIRNRFSKNYYTFCQTQARSLLALFEGEFEARIFSLFLSRWHAESPKEKLDLHAKALWIYFHPQRSPKWAKRLYRRVNLK